MQISKGFNGLSLTYYLIRPCSLILRSFSSPTFCSFTFFCLNINYKIHVNRDDYKQSSASLIHSENELIAIFKHVPLTFLLFHRQSKSSRSHCCKVPLSDCGVHFCQVPCISIHRILFLDSRDI